MVFPNMVRRFDDGGEEKKKKKSWTDDVFEWTDKQGRGLDRDFRNAYHAIGDDWRNLVYPLVTSLGGAAVGTGVGALVGSIVKRNHLGGKQSREVKVPKYNPKAFAHFKDKKGKDFLYDEDFTDQDLIDIQNGNISKELAAKLQKYSDNDNIYKKPDEFLTPEVQKTFVKNMMEKLHDKGNGFESDPRFINAGTLENHDPAGGTYLYPQLNMKNPIDTFRDFRKQILKPYLTQLHKTYWESPQAEVGTTNLPDLPVSETQASVTRALGVKDDPVRNPYKAIKALVQNSPSFKGKGTVFTEKFAERLNNMLQENQPGTWYKKGDAKTNFPRVRGNYDPVAVRAWLASMGYGPQRSFKMAKPFIYNKFLRDYYQYGPEVLEFANWQNDQYKEQDPQNPKEVTFGRDPNVAYSRVAMANPDRIFKQFASRYAQRDDPSKITMPDMWNEYFVPGGPGPKISNYVPQRAKYDPYAELKRNNPTMTREQLYASPEYKEMMQGVKQYQDSVFAAANTAPNSVY